MAIQNDLNELVCLFHHNDHAMAAVNDLKQAGFADSAITIVGGPGADSDAVEKSSLAKLGMPDKDYDHLKSGVRDGGVVVAVSAIANRVDAVEDIFEKHSADKIDEATRAVQNKAPLAAAAVPVVAAAAARPVAPKPVDDTGQTAIPVVEESLVVGKRAVDQGGVRVFRKVVEIPVEQSVNLREEHITLDRRAVDRPATEADFAFGDRVIELTETSEEAVIAKNARVVGEVVVGKTSSEHTETIHDTVRKTEVEVEKIAARDEVIDRTRNNQ